MDYSFELRKNYVVRPTGQFESIGDAKKSPFTEVRKLSHIVEQFLDMVRIVFKKATKEILVLELLNLNICDNNLKQIRNQFVLGLMKDIKGIELIKVILGNLNEIKADDIHLILFRCCEIKDEKIKYIIQIFRQKFKDMTGLEFVVEDKPKKENTEKQQ